MAIPKVNASGVRDKRNRVNPLIAAQQRFFGLLALLE